MSVSIKCAKLFYKCVTDYVIFRKQFKANLPWVHKFYKVDGQSCIFSPVTL